MADPCTPDALHAITFYEARRLLPVLHDAGTVVLLGASTHHALQTRHYLRGRFERVALERTYARVASVAYALTFALGAIVYASYRYHLRGLYLDRYAPFHFGLFDVKEVFAALTLVVALALGARSFTFEPRVLAALLALAAPGCATTTATTAPVEDSRSFVLRLEPGADVKSSLEAFARDHHLRAASVVSAVGSLTDVGLRFADKPDTTRFSGHFEVVSLSGYLAEGELHLHLAVSDGEGRTIGGHVMAGNRVYTTLVLAIDEHLRHRYRREHDAKTNRDELVIGPR